MKALATKNNANIANGLLNFSGIVSFLRMMTKANTKDAII
ncbi:hypothetical protein MALU111345_08810 [Marinicrinis lubricantis]